MKKYLVCLGLALALAGTCAPVAAQTMGSDEWWRWFNLTNAIRQQTQAIQNLRPPIYYPMTPYVWGPPGYPSGGLGALFLLNRVNYEQRMMDEYFRRRREIEDYYARQRREKQDYYDAYLNKFLALSPEDRAVFFLLPSPETRSAWLSAFQEEREDWLHDAELAISLDKSDPKIVETWKALAGVPAMASSSDAAKALRVKLGRDSYGRLIRALIEGKPQEARFEFAVFYFDKRDYAQAKDFFLSVFDDAETAAATKELASHYLKLIAERIAEKK